VGRASTDNGGDSSERRARALSDVLRAAGLVVAAVAGGLVALGGAAFFGGFDGDTVTVREVPVEASAPVQFEQGEDALSIREIYRRAAPGVVQITARAVTQVTPIDPFFGFPFGFPEEREQQALGSGFVIDKAGHIVTNFHVIDGASEIEVSFSNNDSLSATIVGSDASTDIAVLKVAASSRALTPLELGDSDSVQVGDGVVAIGNPLGLTRTTTAGIISALHRDLVAPNGYQIDEVIQTDAQINSGNSGGPLLNARGHVIGVNSQIATAQGSTGSIGISFAVPINTVKDVTAQLIEKGRVERAYLGVSARGITPELARAFRLPVERGLMVEEVVDGSGAAKAGLREGTTRVVVAGESYVLGGDIITRVGDMEVATVDGLRRALSERKPGQRVRVVLYRGDDRKTVEVKLGRQPSAPHQD
jgi:S1-C subfamily serine protease